MASGAPAGGRRSLTYLVRLGQLAVLLEVDEGDGGDPGAVVEGADLGDGVELLAGLLDCCAFNAAAASWRCRTRSRVDFSIVGEFR